jgi:hypothetical protein
MTPVMQAANALEANGYLVGWIHDGPDHSVVAFFDPHTLRKGWRGKRTFGTVIFTGDEIRALRGMSGARAAVLHKVREAEADLLGQIDKKDAAAVLRNTAVKVVLTLSMVMTGISYLA